MEVQSSTKRPCTVIRRRERTIRCVLAMRTRRVVVRSLPANDQKAETMRVTSKLHETDDSCSLSLGERVRVRGGSWSQCVRKMKIAPYEPESRSRAGFPACWLWRLSRRPNERRAEKSTDPAARKSCATDRVVFFHCSQPDDGRRSRVIGTADSSAGHFDSA